MRAEQRSSVVAPANALHRRSRPPSAGASFELPPFSLTDRRAAASAPPARGRVWVAHLTFSRCRDISSGCHRRVAVIQASSRGRMFGSSASPSTPSTTGRRCFGTTPPPAAPIRPLEVSDGRPNQVRQLTRHGLHLPVDPRPDGEPIFPRSDLVLVDRGLRIHGVFDASSADGRAKLLGHCDLGHYPALPTVAHPKEVLDPPWLGQREQAQLGTGSLRGISRFQLRGSRCSRAASRS